MIDRDPPDNTDNPDNTDDKDAQEGVRSDETAAHDDGPTLAVIQSLPSTAGSNSENPNDAAQEETNTPPLGANDEALIIRLTALEQDHQDLGLAIDALESQPHYDRLAAARLKKKKLQLKDKIQEIKNALTPDIIA